MFWINTIKKLKNIENQHYAIVQKRCNQISDYIQGPLQDVINKAIANYFKQLENIIKNKNQNKKDK